MAHTTRLSLVLATTFGLAACESLEPCPQPTVVAIRAFMAFFDSGSTRLTEQAMATVRDVARAMQQDDRVVIAAHTDGSGDPVANLILSYRRAEALRDALTAQGINPSRVDLHASGDQRPIVQTKTREPQNRRAEFVIIRPPSPGLPHGWRRESYSCIDTRERVVQEE